MLAVAHALLESDSKGGALVVWLRLVEREALGECEALWHFVGEGETLGDAEPNRDTRLLPVGVAYTVALCDCNREDVTLADTEGAREIEGDADELALRHAEPDTDGDTDTHAESLMEREADGATD